MRIIYFLFFLVMLTNCSLNDGIPRGILSQQKMRLVLWDLIRIDEYATNFLLKGSSLDPDKEKAKLYEQIFKLHSTKAEIFKKSLTFYQSNPNLLKVIIDSLRSDEQRVTREQYNVDPIVSDTLLPEKTKIKPELAN